jgi:hypothetical protein
MLLLLTVAVACNGAKPSGNSGSGNSNSSAANSSANSNAAQTHTANSNSPGTVQSNTGSIDVSSTPPGARVLLVLEDEGGAGEPQPRGITPTVITGVYPGKYTVHLEMPGYRYSQQSVQVKAGSSVKITRTLKRQ